jgi:hypothetical protein
MVEEMNDCPICQMLRRELDAVMDEKEKLHEYIAEQNKLVVRLTVELAELQIKQSKGKMK